MSAIPEKGSLPESSGIDVAGRFRIYRMDVESTEGKLKEANAMLELLREEINSSRDSEKNLRDQLASAQSRLIRSEQAFTKIVIAFEQQRQIEKTSQRIEEKIEKIKEEIKITQEKSQNVLQHVFKEEELLKETKNLRSLLEKKTAEHDLMKMEIQTLAVEKKNMATTHEQKLREVESELETLKQRQIDAEANYGETLRYYQQQLEERDYMINRSSKKWKGFSDEFEPSQVDSDGIKQADRTTAIETPKRALKAASFEVSISQIKPKESNVNVLRCSQSEEGLNKPNKLNAIKEEDRNHPKVLKKEKPQLEFLTQKQNSSQSAISVGKRRLFTGNSNYYDD